MPVVLAVLLAVVSCGVPVGDAPRPIEPDTGTGPATTPAPGATSARETLYFVRDSSHVAVHRPVARPSSHDLHLDHLLAGPTQAERGTGLHTALDEWQTTARMLQVVAEVAVVEVGDRPGGPIGRNEILAFGQVVCTLTTRPGIGAVSFRSRGQPLDTPAADGSTDGRPRIGADYTSLIATTPDPEPS